MYKFLILLSLSLFAYSQDNVRHNFRQTLLQLTKQIMEQLTPECEVHMLVNGQTCVKNAQDKFSASEKMESETDQKQNSEQLNKQIH